MTELHDRAMAFREKVLGPHGLDATLHDEEAAEFLGDYYNLVTDTAWGVVWNREGLSMRDRRLITMTALIAKQQIPEYQMHLRAALDDGMTKDEIRELLIHLAVYLGFPSSVIFFGHSWPIVKEHLKKTAVPATE